MTKQDETLSPSRCCDYIFPISEFVINNAPFVSLLAREHLTATEQTLAFKLAKKIATWGEVTCLAEQARCLPFVYKHVSQLNLLPVSSDERARMKALTIAHSMQWLKTTATHNNFVSNCLERREIRYASLKGPALAGYYNTPSIRPCRDIDILIDRKDIPQVTREAQQMGFKAFLDLTTGALIRSNSDIDAAIDYAGEITLLSPNSVIIEIHSDLRKDLSSTSTQDILDNVQTVSIKGKEVATLPIDCLFSYLCRHQIRHGWKRLHWSADISAIQLSNQWDLDKVLSTARTLGTELAVRKCLAMDASARKAFASLEATDHAEEVGGAIETFFLSMDRNVHAPYFAEREVRSTETLFQAQRRVWRARLNPSILDYSRTRLPRSLHWVYVTMRLWQGLRRNILRVLKDPGKRRALGLPPQRKRRQGPSG